MACGPVMSSTRSARILHQPGRAGSTMRWMAPDTQQKLRVVGCLPRSPVAAGHRPQIQTRNHLHDESRQVLLWQPLVHRRRQPKISVPVQSGGICSCATTSRYETPAEILTFNGTVNQSAVRDPAVALAPRAYPPCFLLSPLLSDRPFGSLYDRSHRLGRLLALPALR
jgi:hypothetical protein